MDEHPHSHKSHIILQWLILIISTAVLLYVVWLTVVDFETLRLSGHIRPSWRNRHFQAGLSQISPDQIQGWMTFHYINIAFKLPEDYLKKTLAINNAKYPNLSLDTLAKQDKITSAQFLAKVKAVVSQYSKPAAPANSP